MSIKIIIAFIVLFANISTTQADTIGLSWYTYHGNKGPNLSIPADDYWYGKDRLWNNKTRGLYYVKDSGTPLLGDNAIFGYYCNSFSRPERNRTVLANGNVVVMDIQESKCNVTTHTGKVFTLAGTREPGLTWDVTASVELFNGYGKHVENLSAKMVILPVRVHSKYLKIDSFVAPTLSARFGYARIALVGKNDWLLSFEYNFK